MLICSTYAYSNETYTVDAGGLYSKNTGDDTSTEKTTGFGGTFYLKPIVLDPNQPYAELDFIQRASGLTIQYGNASVETSVLAKTTVSRLLLSGNFYINDFIIGFGNSSWNKNFNLKANSNYNYGIDSTTTYYSLGYFVTPSTSINFETKKSDASYTRSSTLLTAYNDLKITTNSLSSHSVTTTGDGKHIVFDLNYDQIKNVQTTTENNNEYGAKIRFYPENKYFIEGGYISNSGDESSSKGKTTLIGAGYSLNPRLYFLATYQKFDGAVSSENSSDKTTQLTVGYRF